jgi:hypothetical protein
VGRGRTALVQRKPVAFGVAGKARQARGKLVHVADLDAAGFESFAHGRDVVDFECCAGRSAGLETQPFAVADSEGRASNIELDPMIAKGVAGLQTEHVAIKVARPRHVRNGVGEERDIFDHVRSSRSATEFRADSMATFWRRRGNRAARSTPPSQGGRRCWC